MEGIRRGAHGCTRCMSMTRRGGAYIVQGCDRRQAGSLLAHLASTPISCIAPSMHLQPQASPAFEACYQSCASLPDAPSTALTAQYASSVFTGRTQPVGSDLLVSFDFHVIHKHASQDPLCGREEFYLKGCSGTLVWRSCQYCEI